MKSMRGISVIEVMIVLAIVGIVSAIAIPHIQQAKNGVEGTKIIRGVEVMCVDGYKFVTTHRSTVQIIDHNGNGIRCN